MKSSSSEPKNEAARTNVKAFVYRDWKLKPGEAPEAEPQEEPAEPQPVGDGLAPELEEEIRRTAWTEARDQLWPEAQRQAELALGATYEQRVQAEHAAVVSALEQFVQTRRQYFNRLERDVVHLILAITRRVLQREAQLDPLLLAGTVRVALEPLATGSSVTLVIAPSQRERWEAHISGDRDLSGRVRVRTDASLEPGGCRLETENGSTDLGWENQIREVEQSFFDLLRRRSDSEVATEPEGETALVDAPL